MRRPQGERPEPLAVSPWDMEIAPMSSNEVEEFLDLTMAINEHDRDGFIECPHVLRYLLTVDDLGATLQPFVARADGRIIGQATLSLPRRENTAQAQAAVLVVPRSPAARHRDGAVGAVDIRRGRAGPQRHDRQRRRNAGCARPLTRPPPATNWSTSSPPPPTGSPAAWRRWRPGSAPMYRTAASTSRRSGTAWNGCARRRPSIGRRGS